jgi:hypothetical protein
LEDEVKLFVVALGLLVCVLLSTGNGDLPIGFQFKSEGEKLTGSMIGPDGTPFPIDAGKVEGNNISFSATLTFNGNPFTLTYKGVLAENQINFTSDFNGQVFSFSVKKAE